MLDTSIGNGIGASAAEAADRPGWLEIDFGDCSRDDLFAAYQDLGVLCFGTAPRRLLLKAGREDADSHYALRDVLRTVARVGGPGALDMSIAVVTASAAVTHVAHAMRADLAPLGCRLHVFSSLEHAKRWLAGRPLPPLTSFINFEGLSGRADNRR